MSCLAMTVCLLVLDYLHTRDESGHLWPPLHRLLALAVCQCYAAFDNIAAIDSIPGFVCQCYAVSEVVAVVEGI